MQLSILIVSYNTRELTLACLRSVYAQTAAVSFETIAVDNDSTDGSADAIAGQFPAVQLIRRSDNLGFAGGNNLAARQATGEYLLLLNPDTVVLDSAIERLHAFAEAHPEGNIFGGRTLFGDGSLNPGSCWRRPTPWSALCMASGLTSLFPRSVWFARESYGSWRRDSVREVDIVSGCFFLIRRSAWEQLRGFDPAFFMYGEEADLCLRARKLGHKCLICPEAQIIHYGGASETVRADKIARVFRAKVQLFERHWDQRWVGFGVRMLQLWAATRLGAMWLATKLGRDRRAGYEAWRDVFRRRGEYGRTSSAAPASAPCTPGAAQSGGPARRAARAILP